MNRGKLIIPALFVLAAGSAFGQTSDGSEVILPLEAQTCNLPSAPARIPEDADLDTLVKAQGQIKVFQTELSAYRECLYDLPDNTNLTEGNEVAQARAHDYSVGMEERIAAQFNTAREAYLARKAEQEAAEKDGAEKDGN